MNWRELVWASLDDPGMSRCAQATGVFLTLCIIVSVLALLLETMPELASYEVAFQVAEVVATVIFTAEIMARVMACPSPSAFCTFLNVVDIFAVLPLYLELVLGSSGNAPAIGALRTFRVLRILKLSRYFNAVRLITGALRLSAVPLFMALFLAMLGCLLFASAMFYIERGRWDPVTFRYMAETGQQSEFQSIADGMWWAIVTLITVGYGDTVPSSGAGKALGVVVALCGVVILAFPISIFAANFSDLYRFNRRRAALSQELSTDVVAGLSKASDHDTEGITPSSLARFPNPHLPLGTPVRSPRLDFTAPAGTSQPVASLGSRATRGSRGIEGGVMRAATPSSVGGAMPSPSLRVTPDSPAGRSLSTGRDRDSGLEALVSPDDAKAAADLLSDKAIRAAHSRSSPNMLSPLGRLRSFVTPKRTPPSTQAWMSGTGAAAREAKSLSEALALAKAARRSLMLSRAGEVDHILCATSFEATDLTSDDALQAACKALCRDARKRIWTKVRRREKQMKDALLIELARRWRSWFDMDADAAIGVSEGAVSDSEWLRREASVLSLAELPGYEDDVTARAAAGACPTDAEDTAGSSPGGMPSENAVEDEARAKLSLAGPRLSLPEEIAGLRLASISPGSQRAGATSSQSGDPTTPEPEAPGEGSRVLWPSMPPSAKPGPPPVTSAPKPAPPPRLPLPPVIGRSVAGSLLRPSGSPLDGALPGKPRRSAEAPSSEGDSDDGTDGSQSHEDGDDDVVYRKHTVRRMVRKGDDVEETTEVVEERRRRRRRRPKRAE